jgi:translation initiation factor 5B
MPIRSPIIVTVGHSDHGKTTLLDRIRGTTVTKHEPGQLTQHTGASYIPLQTIEKISGDLLRKFNIKLEVPGLLFIDTPGHKAFLGMRKRGGAVSDLAILVVDITEGFQEQTDESLKVLKEFKTPFIVAATKTDKLKGWFPQKGSSFLESLEKQRDDVKADLDQAVYKIVSQLSERGFSGERFDRVDNFMKQVAIVPVSSSTGEGFPDLLMMLSGLAQQFLKDKLKLSNVAKGNVLEVKDVRGLGTTLDVILYDGTVRKGDFAVIGGKKTVVTNIRALLVPRPHQELRVEKQFSTVDSVSAAAGIKISAPELDDVIAGSPVIFVKSEEDVETAKNEIRKDVESVDFLKHVDGVTINADTLGSLEAMIKILSEEDVPIRKADVGPPSKQDVVESSSIRDRTKRAILCFNVKVPDEIETMARDLEVKIFSNEIVYRLVDDYNIWVKGIFEKEKSDKLASAQRPCEIRVLGGTVFRQSNPAVFGVEVVRGILKSGATMVKGKKVVDTVKEIQRESKQVQEAKKGDKVAVSMENVTVGRQVFEGDVMRSLLRKQDVAVLKGVWESLSPDERDLVEEAEKI